MKQEKLIVGLIVTAIGLVLIYFGYQKMQPDLIEKSLNSFNDLARSLGGDEMPKFYEKYKTGGIIILILGIITCATGLWFILKSGKQSN